MKRTMYSTKRAGVLADSDYVRPRPHSRISRPVFPLEPVVRIDFGDTVDAVDSGWRTWIRETARVA